MEWKRLKKPARISIKFKYISNASATAAAVSLI